MERNVYNARRNHFVFIQSDPKPSSTFYLVYLSNEVNRSYCIKMMLISMVPVAEKDAHIYLESCQPIMKR